MNYKSMCIHRLAFGLGQQYMRMASKVFMVLSNDASGLPIDVCLAKNDSLIFLKLPKG